jgi:DNA helicase II / ATP-dependent DNA helicase PcrA
VLDIDGFDKDKLDAINYDENTFVVGNPGTGKTFLIVGKVRHLLKKGYDPKKILCMTFTLKATDELNGRLIHELGDEFPEVKDVEVKTFHSFAINSVEEYLASKNIKKKLIKEGVQRYLLYKVLKEMNLFNYGEEYTLKIANLMSQKIGYLRSFGKENVSFDEDKIIEKLYDVFDKKDIEKQEEKIRSFIPFIPKIIENYEKEKMKYGIDYTDMIEYFNLYLDEHKMDYDYVIVDELQDSNEIQAELTFKLASNGKHFVVGDRKQSIFRFQGASIDTFNKFEKDSKLFTLKTNYRSTDEILDYSSHFLINKTGKFQDELSGFKSDKKGIKPRIIRNDSNEVIINYIKEMCDNYKEVAVIARTNWQLAEIAKYLEKLDIPYSMSGSNTSSSEYIKESVLNLIDFLITQSTENVVSVLSSPIVNVEFNDIIKIKEFLSENKEENNFEKLREIEEAKPLIEIYDEFIKNNGGYVAFCKLFDEIILPNTLSLGQQQFLTANYLYKSLKEFFEDGLINDKNNLIDYLKISSEVYEMTVLESDAKVKLYTVHAAKGKEFDSVIYIPRDKKSSNVKFIELAFEGIILQKFNVIEDIEFEKYKVDYVAFTRAKRDLIVINSKNPFHFEKYSEEVEVDSSNLKEITLDESDLFKRYSKVIELLEKCEYDKAIDFVNELRVERPFKLEWLVNYINFKRNEQKSYSFSYFSPYFDCPRKFTFEKILHLDTYIEGGEALKFGKHVHKLLEDMVNGKEINLENEDEKTKISIKNYYDCEEDLKKKIKCNEIEVVGVEDKINIDLSEFLGVECDGVIKGVMDKVVKCKDDGKYVVIDYKTNKSPDSNNMQLHFYRYLYSVKKNQPDENVLTYFYYLCLRDNPIIGSENEYKWNVKGVKVKQYEDKINLIREGIKEIKFGPPEKLLEKNEKGCFYCKFKTMCERLDWEMKN